LDAVRRDGYVLQHVHDQTEEICLAAVKQNGHALQFVYDQTEEICSAAVKQNKKAVQHIDRGNLDQNGVRELTIKEIESLLGYSVKIIKG
jgi:hypothetical protein